MSSIFDPSFESNRGFSRSGLPDSPELERVDASERRFPCTVRLADRGVSITSPRTGATLTVPFTDAPTRVRGRIVQARANGKAVATFTRDELHAFAAAATGGSNDDQPDPTPPAGALFPECATWPDAHLITAIELADRRDPVLPLGANEFWPDRYDAFLHECSAELVRRLEARGVDLAA